MSTVCAVCLRERDPWQVKEYRDGTDVFMACVDPIECGPHYRKVQRRLDKAAFASLGIDYQSYRELLGWCG